MQGSLKKGKQEIREEKRVHDAGSEDKGGGNRPRNADIL